MKLVHALEPLSYDPRDLSLGAVFGTPDIKQVPKTDWIVNTPLVMKNQDESPGEDFCTGFTVSEVSEDQEGVELCPFFQYSMMCMLRNDYTSWGGDLRLAFKSAEKVGSLAVSDRPFNPNVMTRNSLADWNTWKELMPFATKHKKASYFKVDGDYDVFDNIRANLWAYRLEKRTIGVGAMWRREWINAPAGVVQKEYKQGGFGHAFKIFGQKVINGEIHLVAQLSNGPIGDNGIYYFPREVVNREFAPFGQFMFKDMPKEEARFLQDNGLKADASIFTRLIHRIMNIFKLN